MLRNLLDNALKYSPEGASVKILVAADALTVVNSGVSVDDETIGHLSERFFRPAGQKVSGSGLGLSIVKRIAGHYSCRLEFDNTPDGFSVRIAK